MEVERFRIERGRWEARLGRCRKVVIEQRRFFQLVERVSYLYSLCGVEYSSVTRFFKSLLGVRVFFQIQGFCYIQFFCWVLFFVQSIFLVGLEGRLDFVQLGFFLYKFCFCSCLQRRFGRVCEIFVLFVEFFGFFVFLFIVREFRFLKGWFFIKLVLGCIEMGTCLRKRWFSLFGSFWVYLILYMFRKDYGY